MTHFVYKLVPPRPTFGPGDMSDDEVAIITRPASTGYSDIAAAASPRVLADLFWFGRYGERTELVTRMAKVARERYQDFQYRPWMSGTAAVPLLLHAVATVTPPILPGSDVPPRGAHTVPTRTTPTVP